MRWLSRLDAVDEKDVRHAEAVCAGLVALAALILHVVFLLQAGPLWRDEAATAAVAAMPRLADLWASLPFDPSSGLYAPLLRLWGLAFGFSDASLRATGFLAGLGLLLALWAAARSFGARPLFSLVLAGLSPLIIRSGDAVRPYGLGAALLLLAAAAIGKAIRSDARKNWIAAALAAILSVQVLYHNSFFLLGILAGPIFLAWRRNNLRLALRLLGVGLAAAASLLPFLPSLLASSAFHIVARRPPSFEQMLSAAAQAIGAAGAFPALGWLMAFAFCAAMLWRRLEAGIDERDAADFCLLAAAGALAANFVFMAVQQFLPQPRYFIDSLLFLALAADLSLALHARSKKRRLALAAAAASLGLVIWPIAARRAAMRQTNMDLIAARLAAISPDDLIVLNPWFYAISFTRYYRGAAPCMSVPPIESAATNRLDLIKRAMMTERPLAPLTSKIGATLAQGGRVWIVGGLPILRPIPDAPPPDMPPPPLPETGWHAVPYLFAWARQAGYFVETRAKSADFPNVFPEQEVDPQEKIQLEVVYGVQKPKALSRGGAKSAAVGRSRGP